MSEIARILHIRPGSVAFHKYRMMETLGIKTSAALLDYGIRHQMSSIEGEPLQCPRTHPEQKTT